MIKGMTLREAVERFVLELDAIPQSMIEKLMFYEPDGWKEITKPAVGHKVFVGNDEHSGEIIGRKGKKYIVAMDSGEEITLDEHEIDPWFYNKLPMWGTMWSFHDPCDQYWLEEKDGLQKMSDCGFRVFEHEEYGIFFGIDGAGYDFYESHWTPLYKARGLHWHDPKAK